MFRQGFLLLLMSLLLSNLVWAQDDEVLDTASVEVPAEVMDTAPAEVVNDPLEAYQEVKPKPKRVVKKKKKKKSFLESNRDELLALVALLLLWALTRSEEEKKVRRARPMRHSPVTLDELGRLVYGIAKGNNLDDYRALYINGGEARELIGGEAAEAYLNTRTVPMLSKSLQGLFDALNGGQQYRGVESLPDERFALRFLGENGEEQVVPVASYVEVKAVLRLVIPATEW